MQRHAQQGLALITAMLVVAIVASIAAYLSLGQQVWLRQVQNLKDRGQAESMRHAALDWIGVLLKREEEASKGVDHLGEAWAKQFPPLPYEGGTITVSIQDAQGLFNLNNLVKGGKPSGADFAMFQQLLRSQDLSPALAEAVVDWIDPDSEARPGGAEDVEYLASTHPYRAANQLLTSVDELRLIKGFDGESVEKLRPYVTALPAATPTNINTAPEPVLAALFNKLPASAVQALMRARDSQPFEKAEDVQKLLPKGQALPQAQYGFSTAHFLVQVDIGYGRLHRSTLALMHRSGGGKAASVLWHHPLYPKLPSDGEETKTKT